MRVFITEDFSKEIQKVLTSEQRNQLQTFIEKFKNGVQRGKILGPTYLREVKIQSKRVYYVYIDNAALFVAASNKKEQSQRIRDIQQQSNRFLAVLKKLTAQ